MKRALITMVMLLSLSGLVYAQPVSMTLTVKDPLPEIDLSTIIIGQELINSDLFFTLNIVPVGLDVVLKGELLWKDVGSNNFVQIAEFRTRTFRSRTITNQNLGTDIKIDYHNENMDIIQTIRRKGKPTGEFQLYLSLWNETGTVLLTNANPYPYSMRFTNPTQSLTLLTPVDTEPLEFSMPIFTSWTQVPEVNQFLAQGAHYLINANVVGQNESNENALQQEDRIVKNYRVPNAALNINDLKTIFTRTWVPGSQVAKFAIQVKAIIPGIEEPISSTIENFYIRPVNSANFSAINTQLQTVLQNNLSLLPPALVNALLTGQLNIEGFRDGNGNPIPETMVLQLLNQIAQAMLANPELVTITYEQN